MNNVVNHATILAAAPDIRAGRLHPGELLRQCLGRIERFDDRVKAWVSVDAPGALREADQLGEEIRSGHYRGPLHGVPVGIKDIVDVAGWPTRAGSTLRENHQAATDATLVTRLRESGAIILGKTVTTEFACFDPSHTRNPWNLDHTPGGSSSGSAAAVALGMCLAAIGSQTGGSITRPAAYCGVCGGKATFGRVSRAGMVPVSFHLDHPGPLTRCVADLAIILGAISGVDAADPFSSDRPVPDYLARIDKAGPPRLGYFEQFFVERADESVQMATKRALDGFQSAGASVERVPLPDDFDRFLPLHRRVMAVEAAEYHRRQYASHPEAYGPHIRTLLDEGLATSATHYALALRHRVELFRQMTEVLADFDAVLMPAAPSPAPATLETTGDPCFNSPWSYTGLPTVAVPCGLAADGLPIGVQLVGRPFAEAGLLAAAAWCEAVLSFDERPLLWSADQPEASR